MRRVLSYQDTFCLHRQYRTAAPVGQSLPPGRSFRPRTAGDLRHTPFCGDTPQRPRLPETLRFQTALQTSVRPRASASAVHPVPAALRALRGPAPDRQLAPAHAITPGFVPHPRDMAFIRAGLRSGNARKLAGLHARCRTIAGPLALRGRPRDPAPSPAHVRPVVPSASRDMRLECPSSPRPRSAVPPQGSRRCRSFQPEYGKSRALRPSFHNTNATHSRKRKRLRLTVTAFGCRLFPRFAALRRAPSAKAAPAKAATPRKRGHAFR